MLGTATTEMHTYRVTLWDYVTGNVKGTPDVIVTSVAELLQKNTRFNWKVLNEFMLAEHVKRLAWL